MLNGFAALERCRLAVVRGNKGGSDAEKVDPEKAGH